MTLSVTEANKKLEAKEKRDAKAKQAMKSMEGALVRKAVVVLAAGGYGAMKKYGVTNNIKGFPVKLAAFVVTTAAQAMTKGALQQAAAAVSDTSLAVYVENAVATGSLIAGDGDAADGGGGEI